MKKTKVLEVTQIDLVGKRYNGYDMIHYLYTNKFDIKQTVIEKLSDDEKVINLIHNPGEQILMEKYMALEEKLSIKNVISTTSPMLLKEKAYQEADIIHFHQFHNANLSLPFLRKIASEKKVIMSLHDPWLLTGRCVHFYDCNKWKNGCQGCPNLSSFFAMREDKCHDMWNLKKQIFDELDIDIVVSSDWMMNLVKQSPIFENIKKVHKIPFGIDEEKFNKVTNKEARKHFNIPDDSFVFFCRTQGEFKGTEYILEALKNLNVKENVTVITCEIKGLLNDVKDKYNIIDLGLIKDKEMIYAMNACDVFLMPSIAESFGLMAIEAMSCGKPVIVFDNTALPSVTHAPECGYLVKDKDANDLMKVMKHVIENPKEVKERGKKAISIVKKEYSLKVYNDKLNKLYEEVANRKQNNPKYENSYEENENVKQFKYLLNDFTVRAFGTKHPISKALLYKLNKKERKEPYEFTFSDRNIQELIIEYTTKLYDCFTEYKLDNLDNSIKIKLEKLIYLITNNPEYIKYTIIRRLKRK